MSLIECVPNVSEGRRPEVVAALAETICQQAGVSLLDYSADAAHNRSVFTMAGRAHALELAVLALVARAVETVDLGAHRGEHPRLGAVDVVPFVPLADASMLECVDLARRVGHAIADRFGVPIYLYEAAATRPERRRLEDIRRGQAEGLREKMTRDEWAPDFGPRVPHPTAGATVVGARRLLVAYNINLATDRIDVARAIARTIRERDGGLPGVKALGLWLGDRRVAQVSMNLTDVERTPMVTVFDRVAAEAERHGVAIEDSELIGLVPAAALAGTTPEHLLLRHFSPSRILERRLAEAGLVSGEN